MHFEEKFLQHIRSEKLISPGDRIIAAVSGGADSMALLHGLICTQRELGISLIVAHYDHHLRPTSGRDRIFVEKAADKLNLQFLTEISRRAVPATGSVEEFARNLRYDFLLRMARKYSAAAVVTAHTQDDLAETVVMRLLRGTGLAGLQAILPRRNINGLELVRPMLIFSRQEVERFLKDIKVKFVNDPSNQSLDFFRNKVRHVLIPFLEKEFHPGVRENLSRLADTSANDYAFIEEQAVRFLKKSIKTDPDRISIPLYSFRRLHSSLRRTIIRLAYASLWGTAQPLTMAHMDAIDRIVFDEQDPCQKGKICLPKGVGFKRSGAKLILARISNKCRVRGK